MTRAVKAMIRNLRRWARQPLRSVGCSWVKIGSRIQEIRRTVTWRAAARVWKILVGMAEFYSVLHLMLAIVDHWPV